MSVLAMLAFENGYSKLFKFASGFSQSRKLPRLQSTLEFCHPSHGCRQTVGHFQIAESCVIWQVAKSIMQNLGKQRVYAPASNRYLLFLRSGIAAISAISLPPRIAMKSLLEIRPFQPRDETQIVLLARELQYCEITTLRPHGTL